MKLSLQLLFVLTLLLFASGIAYAQEDEQSYESSESSESIDYETEDTGFFCGSTTVFFGDGVREGIVVANAFDEFFLFDDRDDFKDYDRNLVQTLQRDTPVKFTIRISTFYDEESGCDLTMIFVKKIQKTGEPQPGVCKKPLPRFEG